MLKNSDSAEDKSQKNTNEYVNNGTNMDQATHSRRTINDQNKIILQELTDKYEKEQAFNEDSKNVESNSTKEDSSSTPQTSAISTSSTSINYNR